MEFLRSFLSRHLAGKPVVESLNVGCLLIRLSNDRYCRVIRTNNLSTYLLSFSCSRSEKSESLLSIPANLHKTIAEVNESNTAANYKSNRAQTKAINWIMLVLIINSVLIHRLWYSHLKPHPSFTRAQRGRLINDFWFLVRIRLA